MIEVRATVSIKDLVAKLNDLEKRQVPFALAKALTLTAGKVKDAEVREMRDVFDRPTPYTLNSLFTRPATKTNLTAYVWLKADAGKGTPADKYLLPEVLGGERRLKRFEKALRAVGALPEGYYAVPGDGARMDDYGNMSRGQIVQILSYFRAFPEAGYKANMTASGRAKLARSTKKKRGFAYFVGRPGDGKAPLGVWQRTGFGFGSAIKPVLIFVDGARYEKLLDFQYVAEKVAERELRPTFERTLTEALATARQS